MAFPLLVGGAIFVDLMYSSVKAGEMDEKALRKYASAFERKAEADKMLLDKSQEAEAHLENVVKKKRCVREITFPQFLEIYGKIQKIIVEERKNELVKSNFSLQEKYHAISEFALSIKQPVEDKALVYGVFRKGLGKSIQMDSERYMSAARNQMREANVYYADREVKVVYLDSISERAKRIADLLKRMNFLFGKVVQRTKELIEEKGTDVRSYSEGDKSVLMECVNFAYAVRDIMDILVLDENGKIAEEAEKAILASEDYLQKMQTGIQE